MVTLDRWNVYSLSRCVHTLDQVELDSQHIHSSNSTSSPSFSCVIPWCGPQASMMISIAQVSRSGNLASLFLSLTLFSSRVDIVFPNLWNASLSFSSFRKVPSIVPSFCISSASTSSHGWESKYKCICEASEMEFVSLSRLHLILSFLSIIFKLVRGCKLSNILNIAASGMSLVASMFIYSTLVKLDLVNAYEEAFMPSFGPTFNFSFIYVSVVVSRDEALVVHSIGPSKPHQGLSFSLPI